MTLGKALEVREGASHRLTRAGTGIRDECAMRRPLSRIMAVPIVLALATAAFGASYDEQRLAAVAACEAIDPRDYQSGLLFNPDGYRSYFVRSECFQRVAREFRDSSLCEQVRQRRSLFVSSWG